MVEISFPSTDFDRARDASSNVKSMTDNPYVSDTLEYKDFELGRLFDAERVRPFEGSHTISFFHRLD